MTCKQSLHLRASRLTPTGPGKNEETLLTIRKAKLTDVPDIHGLISHYAEERIMLPRTLPN